jgi:predicted  nucleic acid-binding Zn-ribbon protein
MLGLTFFNKSDKPQATAADLKARIAELEEKQAAAHARLSAIEKEADSIYARPGFGSEGREGVELGEELEKIRQRAAVANKEKLSIEREIESVKREMIAVDAVEKETAMRESLANAEDELTKATTRRGDLRSQLAKLEERSTAMKQSLSTLKSELEIGESNFLTATRDATLSDRPTPKEPADLLKLRSSYLDLSSRFSIIEGEITTVNEALELAKAKERTAEIRFCDRAYYASKDAFEKLASDFQAAETAFVEAVVPIIKKHEKLEQRAARLGHKYDRKPFSYRSNHTLTDFIYTVSVPLGRDYEITIRVPKTDKASN